MTVLTGTFTIHDDRTLSSHFEGVEGMKDYEAFGKAQCLKHLPCVTFPETFDYAYESAGGDLKSETTGYAFLLSDKIRETLALQNGDEIEVQLDTDQPLEVGCQPRVIAARQTGAETWHFDQTV